MAREPVQSALPGGLGPHAPDFTEYRLPEMDAAGIDVQVLSLTVPVADKKLQWIHGTTRRWDGYLEFQRHPEPMLEWFAKHMS